MQRGVQLHALRSTLRAGLQADVGLLGAALQVERQLGHDDGLIGGRVGGQIAQLLGAQIGLELQTAVGQGLAGGGLQALEDVAPTAIPVELQLRLAIELGARERVFHAGQGVGPGDERGGGVELQIRVAFAVLGADLAIGLQHRAGHFGLELDLRVLLIDVVFHGAGVDGGLQRFDLHVREREHRLLPFALGGERLDAQRFAANARRGARGLEIGFEGHLLRGVCFGAQCALQRRGVERAVEIGGVQLLDLGIALEHLGLGFEITVGGDAALGHVDVSLLDLPLLAGVEHIGGDGV